MPADLSNLTGRYLDAKKQSDAIGKELKDLKEDMFIVLEEVGSQDDKGSFIASVKVGKKDVSVKKEKRTGVSLDHVKAMEFLKEKGMKDCIKQVPTVDEEALEKAVLEGRITDQEFRKMTVTKETFALIVK